MKAELGVAGGLGHGGSTGCALSDVTKPTFLFCIGAQKAGTTWLYNYLDQHPQVHVPEVKEVHYFDSIWLPNNEAMIERRQKLLGQRQHKYDQRRALGMHVAPDAVRRLERSQALAAMHDGPVDDHSGYRALMMKGRTQERCVADITPSYSSLKPQQFSQLLDEFAPAKILFILRDPVERMWSHIKMHCAGPKGVAKNLTPDGIIATLLQGQGITFRQRGAMDLTLADLAVLPQDRVKVMFYETLFQDAQINELCDFLGVDFAPGQYGTRVNQGEALAMTDEQHATLRWLNGPTYRAIHEAVGDDIPAAWDMGAVTAPRPAFLSVSEIHEQILQGRTT